MKFPNIVNFLFILACLTSLSCLSCDTPTPKSEDITRLQRLREVYGRQCEFKLEEGLYLTVRSLEDESVSKSLASEIYELFWLDDKKRRRTTSYVYLNVLNKTGEFQFQLALDPKTGEYVISHRAYY